MGGLNDDKLKELLAKQSKGDLVEWIVEQAGMNEDLRRALIDFIGAEADVKTLLSELRRMITRAWQRTRTSRHPWKLARPISSDLAPVVSSLEQLIERGHAAEAEKVLRRFVEAADKGFEHVDDSSGLLWPLCQEAVSLWGKAWARIEPRDHEQLAQMVFGRMQDNCYATLDHMIRDFAAALGREGLLRLKDMFLEQHKARQADEGLDDWQRSEPLRHVAEVADALGDVDLYIDVQRQRDQLGVYALPIARRLLDAGRPDEALNHLDRSDPSRSCFRGEEDDYTTLRCRILQSLGRDDEARETLWQAFAQRLDRQALDRYLAMVPEDQREAEMQRAVAVAEKHGSKLTAALFLVDRGQPERAARLVMAYPDAFDGRVYECLVPLAETLQQDYPAAAWVLYRALLLDILEEGRTKAYHHAADYLAITHDLADRADLPAEQQELLSHLREKHSRKYSFWERVNE